MIKKVCSSVLLIFLLCVSGYGESVFSLHPVKDPIIGAAAIGLAVPALVIDPVKSDSIGAKSGINGFDRQFMNSYNGILDKVGTGTAFAALALPAISFFGNDITWKNTITYGVMYAEAFLLTFASKELLKAAVPRNRPYTYFGEIPKGEEKDYYNSFPSGHTAYAFLGASFLAATFSAEFPDSKWKIPVIAGGYTLAAAVGAMRIASGNHFMTDVLAGACIGSLYGWLVPMLHINRGRASPGGAEISMIPGVKSFLVSISF